MVHPRVLGAMGRPLLGHLDPEFLVVMEEIQRQLRLVFRTGHRFTIPISGTGSAGMEAAIVNFVEPGDEVLVGLNGAFGLRQAAMVQRAGGIVVPVEAPWGHIIEPDAIETALAHHPRAKAVVLVHAETSTGVLQPLADIGGLCRRHGALLIVDAVTSLGGVPVEVDAWEIDVCYSATQKCLSCPPGLAPLTLSEKAEAVIRERRTACHSWYLDLSLLADYWVTGKRAYHHTAPISMLYGLSEALRLIEEERLPERWGRHRKNSERLAEGLSALGLSSVAQEGHRLPTLHCVAVPPHLDEGHIRERLLREFGIEIGGGLGPWTGKVWRIGLMGESSTEGNVTTLLQALRAVTAGHRPHTAQTTGAGASQRGALPV